MITIQKVNELSKKDFVLMFCWIFDEKIVEQVSELRPFPSYQFLHLAVKKLVKKSPIEQKLLLLQAFPSFVDMITHGSSQKADSKLAGLQSLSSREYKKFVLLNNKYEKKFGFPFVISVRGHNKQSIYDALKKRVKQSETEEILNSLEELLRIYFYRLRETIQNEESYHLDRQSM
ncbi:2-oxo-4-hydroxy-4-carboxy-5-ureidoimidazoline decarboxylase [Metabacillus halosaccharovorans]|uniref:2-oxo-4-hydroxy-4-carboxy-5-ureidoimidazoline decarboxylase n=1 Tax=Metabacillus halosaccharovorans TaxID=930124 RepID=UPI001C201474|nr:2-oxo-4-hydroxy-4-carboxy-5-ureidoimidazoline decarboxylase [Metabacillus halosaccharovorans]MBU7593084.1 2-oxo-4-hydroxy-4-carboxy-5-ureidoimidazoline decarboxylase [Metabacillus halosaccharovorans]